MLNSISFAKKLLLSIGAFSFLFGCCPEGEAIVSIVNDTQKPQTLEYSISQHGPYEFDTLIFMNETPPNAIYTFLTLKNLEVPNSAMLCGSEKYIGNWSDPEIDSIWNKLYPRTQEVVGDGFYYENMYECYTIDSVNAELDFTLNAQPGEGVNLGEFDTECHSYHGFIKHVIVNGVDYEVPSLVTKIKSSCDPNIRLSDLL